MIEENRHRIIIGVFGENDPYPEIPKIVRKTTYGKELDFYKLTTETMLKKIPNEKFRTIINKDSNVKEPVSLILELIRSERFWECHEVLEDRWRKLDGVLKEIARYLIRIFVGQVKWQMGQYKLSEEITNDSLMKLNKLTGLQVNQILKRSEYPMVPGKSLDILLKQIYIN